ncbi:cell wall hydrolase [Phenylobacterium montanum]|uniref:Cell wall hydrolase n=1 Tax=Phenylobacterium montanum TaxID=2823693 RepID=A0A975IT71_9CAUL|nr:cell wall hydrolase [Caulobacter sp. S6]QUD86478.1 cell wall hydrolase [Caulobacter sp. S6]
MVAAAASLVWASHAPLGAQASGPRRHPIAGGGFTLAAFLRLDPQGPPIAQRYDPLARIARAGLPDAAHAQAPAAGAPAPPAQTFEDLTPQQAALVNAQIPFSQLPIQAAKPFRLPSSAANDRARALTCLTMAVYYEAASESDAGQAAVAQVVLNRVRHPIFPKSVCGVVFQGSTLPTGCQFTFTCDGSLNRRPSQAGWARAQKIAQRALDGYVLKSVGEATHYHTQWVVPYWRPTLVKETQIGAHIFYRWPGGMGLPADFGGKYAGFEPPPPPIPGFDTGQTTVMIARADKPAALAQIAEIDTPAATREAVREAQAAPLTDPAPLAIAPPPAVITPPASAAPQKPVYFGKPFRQHRGPTVGG